MGEWTRRPCYGVNRVDQPGHVIGRRVVAGCTRGAGAVIVVGDALERSLMLQDAGDGYCFAQLFRVDLVDGKRLGWREQTY